MNKELSFLCLCLNVIIPALIIFTSIGAVIYGIKYKKIKKHKYTYEWVYSFVIAENVVWAIIFSYVLYKHFFPSPEFYCENPRILLILIRPSILFTTTIQYVLNKLKYLKTKRYECGGKKQCQKPQSE
jgi:hypothetical protein